MSVPRAVPLWLCAVLLSSCVDQPTQPTSDVSPQSSAAGSCGQRANATIALLLNCVTIDGVRAHQAALQEIADENGGIRYAGTAGYTESVAYVRQRLEAAGYVVTVQPFDHTGQWAGSALLEQVSPGTATYGTRVMSYSAPGDVTAPVSDPGGDERGCNAADFAGFPAGAIALMERGAPPGFPAECTFALKATNAYNAGASAVIIYNDVPGEINGTLGSGFSLDIPVVAVTQSLGQQLAATPGLVMRVKVEVVVTGTITSHNVLAELAGSNPGNVVMVGAHLDGVFAGPGINDNGSGVAAVLETAIQMARVRPANTVRFAFWGSEEQGLVGSTHYVTSLTTPELQRIALYLNFDMIGSPNSVFFVYDGDDSDGVGAGAGPAGSDQVEAVFEEYYALVGRPFKGSDFDGRSDYAPFIDAAIPAGGLFTGAEGIKSPAEAATWGGVAGVAYDPCYHQACDTYDNVNLGALDINADGVAYATLMFAMSTERVNSIKGRGPIKARGSFQFGGAAATSEPALAEY